MPQIKRTAAPLEKDAAKRQKTLERARTAVGGTTKAQGSQLNGGEIFLMPELEKFDHIVGEHDYNGSPWYSLRLNATNGRTYKLSVNTFSKGLRLPENDGEISQQNGKFAEIVEKFKFVLDAWLFCSWVARKAGREQWKVSVEEITELEWGSKDKQQSTPTRVKSLDPLFAYDWAKGLKAYLGAYPDTEMVAASGTTANDDDDDEP